MTSTAEKERTPEVHSSIVGGSTASQRINCPASYQTEQQLPAETEKVESSYAAEGTALHEAMAYILDKDIVDLEDIVGMEFYNHTMTHDLVADAIVPCVEFLDTLFDEDPECEFLIETKCEIPGIPGAFGTSDLVMRLEDRTIILDYKFGAGRPVYASYPTGQQDEQGNDVEAGNPQLMFYARGALQRHPDMFGEGDDWPVELIILQPRISEDMGKQSSRFVTNVRDLEDFRLLLVSKIEEAMGPNPHRERGPWCEWKRCKTICPKFTGPLLDLTKMVDQGALDMDKTDLMPEDEYAQLLADLMNFGDIVDELVKEAQKQAFTYLEDGMEIPGWVLRAKRPGHDKWNPDKSFDQIDRMLGNKGLAVEERRKVDHITPAAARKALAKLDKELDEEKYVAKGASSGYTLGRAETTTNPITKTNMVEFAKRIANLAG